MISNIFRALSLGLAALAIYYDKSIVWVAACGGVGELMALGVSWVRLSRKCGVPVWVGLRSTCVGTVFIVLSGALMAGGGTSFSWPLLVGLTLVVCAVAFLLMRHMFGEFRHYLSATLGNFLPPRQPGNRS